MNLHINSRQKVFKSRAQQTALANVGVYVKVQFRFTYATLSHMCIHHAVP